MSKLEDELENVLKLVKIKGFVREYRFHPKRKWRLDFAWVDRKIGVEVEGGIWLPKSGHNTGVGITRDIDKGNALVLLGWRVLRVTEKMIKTGQAIDLIETVLYTSSTYRLN